MYGEIRVAWFQSYQFRQINPDCSGFQATFMTNVVSIVSIQADQSRQVTVVKLLMFLNRFNRINSCRSIPTKLGLKAKDFYFPVSIVSIHADQSRLQKVDGTFETIPSFQSYQFMQINPDNMCIHGIQKPINGFQSYQFMQINPDEDVIPTFSPVPKDVSIVSIHADQSRLLL